MVGLWVGTCIAQGRGETGEAGGLIIGRHRSGCHLAQLLFPQVYRLLASEATYRADGDYLSRVRGVTENLHNFESTTETLNSLR